MSFGLQYVERGGMVVVMKFVQYHNGPISVESCLNYWLSFINPMMLMSAVVFLRTSIVFHICGFLGHNFPVAEVGHKFNMNNLDLLVPDVSDNVCALPRSLLESSQSYSRCSAIFRHVLYHWKHDFIVVL